MPSRPSPGSQVDDGEPSLFVYAVLDYPLGGPAFFFVTGFAGGFGLNRDVVLPKAENLRDFPLIEQAIAASDGTSGPLPSDPMAALDKLKESLPAVSGQSFAAIGVRFTSFKVMDSFALLIARFGHRFEIDLLGVSDLVSPPREQSGGIPPVAEAKLALKATFSPDEGVLTVRAVLAPDSYVLSRDCHLEGGFAFYSWSRTLGDIEAGDFVVTLGGYHPQFEPPAHYPDVPRLGMQWQVTPNLSLKGSAYYALTAHALMAGGRLEAVWQSGDVRASFVAVADFLLTWQPYHYGARIGVAIVAEVTIHFFGTHHLSFDASALVHLWGPEFAGKAHVDVKVLGFDVAFDVSFGSGTSLAGPVDWAAFRASLLPERPCGSRCSAASSKRWRWTGPSAGSSIRSTSHSRSTRPLLREASPSPPWRCGDPRRAASSRSSSHIAAGSTMT